MDIKNEIKWVRSGHTCSNVEKHILEIIEEINTRYESRFREIVERLFELKKQPEPQTELKPCPFCGGNKITVTENNNFYRAVCERCSSCGPCCVTENSAGKKWNVQHVVIIN